MEVKDDLRELLNPPAVFAGMRFRARLAEADNAPPSGAPPDELPAPPAAAELRPRYDAERRAFILGDAVLKRFKQSAPNQQRLLMAFEEAGWPEQIDDPLPGSRVDAQKRLHDTVRSLNRSLRTEALNDFEPAVRRCTHTVQFHVDGDGERVHWRLASVARGARSAAKQRAPRVALFAG